MFLVRHRCKFDFVRTRMFYQDAGLGCKIKAMDQILDQDAGSGYWITILYQDAGSGYWITILDQNVDSEC